MLSRRSAKIVAAIAELERDARGLGPDAPARVFARLALAGIGSPWVDVYLQENTMMDLWYPFEDAPSEYFRILGIRPLPGTMVVALSRPECTLAADRVDANVLARFLDTLFVELYACGEDYALDVKIQRFGGGE